MSVKVVPHGTRSGYYNSKCRCDECRGAMRVYVAELRAWHRQRQEEPPLRQSLVAQLSELEQTAVQMGFEEARAILRMHIRAAVIDKSLDAVRRGEL